LPYFYWLHIDNIDTIEGWTTSEYYHELKHLYCETYVICLRNCGFFCGWIWDYR